MTRRRGSSLSGLREHFRLDGTPKREYDDREAQEAAHRLGHGAYSYHCGFCDGYHITQPNAHRKPKKWRP